MQAQIVHRAKSRYILTVTISQYEQHRTVLCCQASWRKQDYCYIRIPESIQNILIVK